MRAAMRGAVLCAQAVLEHGASTEPENWNGKAALQLARENGHLPVAKLIEEVGGVRRGLVGLHEKRKKGERSSALAFLGVCSCAYVCTRACVLCVSLCVLW